MIYLQLRVIVPVRGIVISGDIFRMMSGGRRGVRRRAIADLSSDLNVFYGEIKTWWKTHYLGT